MESSFKLLAAYSLTKEGLSQIFSSKLFSSLIITEPSVLDVWRSPGHALGDPKEFYKSLTITC